MSRGLALAMSLAAALVASFFALSSPVAAKAGVQAGSVAAGPKGPRTALVRVAEASADRGTAFRGIAIGDDKRQVNRALGELGLRCMTDSEKEWFARKGIILLETMAGLNLCRIIDEHMNTRGGSDVDYYIDQVVAPELMSGFMLNAVYFDDGVVSKLHLQPSFFNAERMDVWSFARSIISGYMQPGTLYDTASGPVGQTPEGDALRVLISPNGRKAILEVERATSENVPTFD